LRRATHVTVEVREFRCSNASHILLFLLLFKLNALVLGRHDGLQTLLGCLSGLAPSRLMLLFRLDLVLKKPRDGVCIIVEFAAWNSLLCT
jgi:hypothetical protein